MQYVASLLVSHLASIIYPSYIFLCESVVFVWLALGVNNSSSQSSNQPQSNLFLLSLVVYIFVIISVDSFIHGFVSCMDVMISFKSTHTSPHEDVKNNTYMGRHVTEIVLDDDQVPYLSLSSGSSLDLETPIKLLTIMTNMNAKLMSLNPSAATTGVGRLLRATGERLCIGLTRITAIHNSMKAITSLTIRPGIHLPGM
jgi:hypothetical protein